MCLVLTSRPSCLVGEPTLGEKGLSGLVRPTELRGLARILAVEEPGTLPVTMQGKKKWWGLQG